MLLTGPFITIPFLFAGGDPYDPQWLIDSTLAAFLCVNDACIWSELSSMMPRAEGSCSYLRECFGRHVWKTDALAICRALIPAYSASDCKRFRGYVAAPVMCLRGRARHLPRPRSKCSLPFVVHFGLDHVHQRPRG